jgi:cytochrome c-type biogenesis protein
MLEISGIGAVTAFAAGLISFLSPCVLPLVPGYVSYVAGQSLEEVRTQTSLAGKFTTVSLSLCFVLGFSTVFVALGASATAIGQLLLSYRYEVNIVGGTVVILFGLFMSGLLPVHWLARELRFSGPLRGGHPLGAFVLGLAFAFGWTPCIGPVLGAILTVSASAGRTVDGVSLLSIYSLGLGLPFLGSAAFMETFLERVGSVRRMGRQLQMLAGFIMVAMGLAMITGYMTTFSYWLLQTFPVLQTIG